MSAPTTYWTGSTFVVEWALTDLDGNPVTGATVAGTITKPDGSTAAMTASEPEPGTHRLAFTFTVAGPHSWRAVASGTVTDAREGQVLVHASQLGAAEDDADDATLYVSMEEMRAAVGVRDPARDPALRQALRAACRHIDRLCGRRFYPDTTATARTFPTSGRVVTRADGELLMVDDIADTTDLTVGLGTTSAGTFTAYTGYELEPVHTGGALPYTGLFYYGGAWSTSRLVRVTARWGWPEVPDDVAQAALIAAMRLFKRPDSPFGVAGMGEWGPIRVARMDPDVRALLSPYLLAGIA